MDEKKLKKILDDHRIWLESDGKEGRRADFSDANLSRANLTHADLTGAILSGANLWSADLSDAGLRGANLRRAILSDAGLRGANLTRAGLEDANLSDADLTGADLTDAYLTNADLTRADLTGANLTHADLRRANLTGANLTCANLTSADLSDADLMRAINLTQDQLDSAFITEAGRPPKGLGDLKPPPVSIPQDDPTPEHDNETIDDEDLAERIEVPVVAVDDQPSPDNAPSATPEFSVNSHLVSSHAVIRSQCSVLRTSLSELLGESSNNHGLVSLDPKTDTELIEELGSLRDSIEVIQRRLEGGASPVAVAEKEGREYSQLVHDFLKSIAASSGPLIGQAIGYGTLGLVIIGLVSLCQSLGIDPTVVLEPLAAAIESLGKG